MMNTTRHHAQRKHRFTHARRGVGVAVVVIMLVIINIAVVGAVRASGEESQVGAMRAETARAFYVAESAGRVVLKCSMLNTTLPAAGSTLTLGSASANYVSVPASGQPGDAIIQGSDGTADRRVKVTLAGS